MADIVCRALNTRIRLERYLKEQHPKMKEVFHHVPWLAVAIPKVMARNEGKPLKFLRSGPKKQHIYSAVSAARLSTTCSLHWMLKFAPGRDHLEPCGVAVVTNQTLIIPGHGELSLGT